MPAFPCETVPRWPPSQASPVGKAFLQHPGQAAVPTSTHPTGPSPLYGEPCPQAAPGAHHSPWPPQWPPQQQCSFPLFSTGTAQCRTSHRPPSLPHTHLLPRGRLLASPPGCFLPLLSSEYHLHPENNCLGLHPGASQPPCHHGSSASRPSGRGGGGQPLPHPPLLRQSLTSSSSLSQQPPPAFAVPSRWDEPWATMVGKWRLLAEGSKRHSKSCCRSPKSAGSWSESKSCVHIHVHIYTLHLCHTVSS